MSRQPQTSERVMYLNMGPQHPATHGVLRIRLALSGETVEKAEVVLGHLHRGTEKIAEHKTYHQFIPYMDRLDYLGPIPYELAWVRAVEALLGIEEAIPGRARYIRTLLAELCRIESHLIWYGSHAMDIGAWTAFIYSFREREKIYDLLEELTGQRMNNAYLRIGGVAADLTPKFISDLKEFIAQFQTKALPELHGLLTDNPIWKARTRGIGVISREEALSLSLTGPVARASGVDWDLRRDQPYEMYDRLSFAVPTHTDGDTYARYIVRMEEMAQSAHMIEQCIAQLPDGPVLADLPKIVPPEKDRIYESMENLIHHFKLFSSGFSVPRGEIYSAVEAPKGELGVYIVSMGGPKPWRVHLRVPSFYNLKLLEYAAPGHLVADVVALIGTVDIVLGDIDR